MDKIETQALQVTKEIIVKFIEIGRISPGNFSDYFAPVYHEVLRTIGSPLPETPRRIAREEPERP